MFVRVKGGNYIYYYCARHGGAMVATGRGEQVKGQRKTKRDRCSLCNWNETGHGYGM